jgi:hypothetical protein
MDPEGQQVYYLWSWGDSNSSWLGPFESGAVTTAVHSWSVEGNYTVKVKAKDMLGMESGWSDPIIVHIGTSPGIEIDAITGGFGRVTVLVKNSGGDIVSNINWSIGLDDGFVLLGRKTTGTITEIQPDNSAEIQSRFLFGIGKVTITVRADVVETSVPAFLLGPFVIIKV